MSVSQNKHRPLHATLKCLVVVLILVSVSAHARSSGGYLEISHSTASKSIDNARTFALYSPPFNKHRELLYAGLRITQFDLEQSTDNKTVWRIFLGATIEHPVAPFIEIGTDLLGLFLIDDNDEEDSCINNNDKCSIDGYFRIGFRSVIHDNFVIGLFHETISFGDFHSSLKGDHDYFGVSIGTKF